MIRKILTATWRHPGTIAAGAFALTVAPAAVRLARVRTGDWWW